MRAIFCKHVYKAVTIYQTQVHSLQKVYTQVFSTVLSRVFHVRPRDSDRFNIQVTFYIVCTFVWLVSIISTS